MNDKELLKQLRDQLADIQATTHDTLEPSANRKIEEAIEDLDFIIENSSSEEVNYKAKALEILGRVLSYLPSIMRLIKFISEYSDNLPM